MIFSVAEMRGLKPRHVEFMFGNETIIMTIGDAVLSFELGEWEMLVVQAQKARREWEIAMAQSA